MSETQVQSWLEGAPDQPDLRLASLIVALERSGYTVVISRGLRRLPGYDKLTWTVTIGQNGASDDDLTMAISKAMIAHESNS